MRILGIETSGHEGSVALFEEGRIVGERILSGQGQRHAQALTSELALLFEETGTTPADCQGVAVSVGPGSFTGLRIGVTCAKTFAYSVGCRITGVETLQAIAQDCPAEIGQITLVADAGRGDLYVGQYRFEESQWTRLGPIEIHPALEWIGSRSPEEIIAGPGLKRWQEKFAVQSSLRPKFEVPRAGTICKIGERQFRLGQIADVWSLEPYYLRRSSAEEQWDRRHKSK